ncbi:lysophospholipid acyltransferase family protein [Hwanghaeella sp.]|uniref:lysophospholipid acyltransferase family protein n=1 Tax=Hwanghaeella sp. TaxID=2605943 RepID=UPI003CCC1433
MRIGKRILQSDGLRRFLCWLISVYLRLVYHTSRWDHRESEFLDPLVATGEAFVIALWHNRVVMMPYAWRRKNRPITIFTSDHRDGRLVAYSMGWFGFDTVFGSTKRTEMKTIRLIVRSLKDGRLFGMTPDGPRGPRMRVKSGVVAMARMADVAIIPVAYSCKRRVVMDTWDRLIVPLPFNRGVFLWGEPVRMPPGATAEEVEAARLLLENRMIELTSMADREMGHEPIEPAALDDFRRGSRDKE